MSTMIRTITVRLNQQADDDLRLIKDSLIKKIAEANRGGWPELGLELSQDEVLTMAAQHVNDASTIRHVLRLVAQSQRKSAQTAEVA